MATVADVTSGSSVSETENGVDAVRAFLVSNVGGTGSQAAAKALRATRIPALYSYHPSILDLQCYNKTAEVASGSSSDQFTVLCRYKKIDDGEVPQDEQPGTGGTERKVPPQINIGGTVQTVQTTNDKDGEPIALGPLTVIKNGEETNFPEQTGVVNIQVPQVTVRFVERRAESPGSLAFIFVGTVNSTNFLGLGPGKVLCTRINGVSEDGGKSFKTEYEFQTNLNGWDANVIYIDQETGLPLEGATEDNGGKKKVPIYPTQDFNILKLI